MTKSVIMDKYQINSIEIDKVDIEYKNVDEIIKYLEDKIENDPIAKFIAIFDHYEHTKGLESGEISDAITDAKNIIFCFGQKLPNPSIMAVRPRSIAVAEEKDSFTISFMEAPMTPMNDKMVAWVKALIK